MTGYNIEIPDTYYGYDRRCPYHIDSDAIGICDICGNEVYEEEEYNYTEQGITHNICEQAVFKEFIRRYNRRLDYKPKKFRIERY